MGNLLTDVWLYITGYGIRLLDALVILIIILISIALGYRQHRKQLARLRNKLDGIQDQYAQTTKSYLEDVAHELVREVGSILHEAEEVWQALPANRLQLREKQGLIVAQSHELIRKLKNIVRFLTLKSEPLAKTPVNIKGLVQKVTSELVHYAEVRGVDIQVQLNDVGRIYVNKELAGQLIANILHNAIKYSTANDGIDIKLYRIERAGQPFAYLDVRDFGKGIMEKDKERIFELQTRADGLLEPGSGLGLNFARQIAKQHGGDVMLVDSKPKEGSTFRIILPYE